MNKPLSKKQRSNLISAWAKQNILCAYLEDQKNGTNIFTSKFDPSQEAREIYRLLDGVVSKIDDSDLE